MQSADDDDDDKCDLCKWQVELDAQSMYNAGQRVHS